MDLVLLRWYYEGKKQFLLMVSTKVHRKYGTGTVLKKANTITIMISLTEKYRNTTHQVF